MYKIKDDNLCPICKNAIEISEGFLVDSMNQKVKFEKKSCLRCGLTNWNLKEEQEK